MVFWLTLALTVVALAIVAYMVVLYDSQTKDEPGGRSPEDGEGERPFGEVRRCEHCFGERFIKYGDRDGGCLFCR